LQKRNQMARTVVIVLSIIVALSSAVLFVFFRVEGNALPLWDKVALGYGVVFCLALFLDRLGKEASRLRLDATGIQRGRPRPRPSNAAGQQVAVSASSGRGDAHREADEDSPDNPDDQLLLLVLPQQLSLLQVMADTAVVEILALQNRLPEVDADGHVTEIDVALLVTDDDVEARFITIASQRVGCLVVRHTDVQDVVELLYVASNMRRRGIASMAMATWQEAHALCAVQIGAPGAAYAADALGTPAVSNIPSVMTVALSKSNMRARRFFAANGFSRRKDSEHKPPSSPQTDIEIWIYKG